MLWAIVARQSFWCGSYSQLIFDAFPHLLHFEVIKWCTAHINLNINLPQKLICRTFLVREVLEIIRSIRNIRQQRIVLWRYTISVKLASEQIFGLAIAIGVPKYMIVRLAYRSCNTKIPKYYIYKLRICYLMINWIWYLNMVWSCNQSPIRIRLMITIYAHMR